MVAKQWTLDCPHCRKRFVMTAAELTSANMKAAGVLMRDYEDADGILADYPVTCPRCSQFVPFEPRSRYRQRKTMALKDRLRRLESMRPSDEAEKRAILMARSVCAVVLESLQSDVPLDTVRENALKLRASIDAEVGEHPGIADQEAFSMIGDTLSVACADVGERADLPGAPAGPATPRRKTPAAPTQAPAAAPAPSSRRSAPLGPQGILAHRSEEPLVAPRASPAAAVAPAAVAESPGGLGSHVLPLLMVVVLLVVASATGVFDDWISRLYSLLRGTGL
jgi:hypothetical protein